MDSLGRGLVIAFLILTIVMTATVVTYYYRTRRRSNNYFDDPKMKLRYDLQRQVNYQGDTIGYECLLRQKQPDGSWKLPKHLQKMPLQRVIKLLETAFADLPKGTEQMSLAINMDHEQIASPEFTYFVRWALSQVRPMTLIVEYRPDRILHGLARRQFKKALAEARGYGMQLAIDDVDASKQTLRQLNWLLDDVDMLKCDMHNFRKEGHGRWLDMNLQSWNELAHKHGLALMLTGIETARDDALAVQLNIRYRQGYLFGKPEQAQQLEAQ